MKRTLKNRRPVRRARKTVSKARKSARRPARRAKTTLNKLAERASFALNRLVKGR